MTGAADAERRSQRAPRRRRQLAQQFGEGCVIHWFDQMMVDPGVSGFLAVFLLHHLPRLIADDLALGVGTRRQGGEKRGGEGGRGPGQDGSAIELHFLLHLGSWPTPGSAWMATATETIA